jgi:hypothetical protein
LCTTLVVACLNPAGSYAQGSDQHRPEEQSEPYHKHHDTRHGHDHFYPDRGAIVRDLPRGTIGTSYAGVSYRYHDGIWLEPRGPAYMVIAPPVGLVAPTLPLFSTVVTHGGETFLYTNDTYYRPRPDLGGYEVVNDPIEESSQAAPEALVGGLLPGAPASAAPAASSLALTPGLAVPAVSTTAALPATARVISPTVATQGASFPPPPSTSVAPPSGAMVVAAAVPVTAAASTPTGSASTPATSVPAAAALPVAVPAGPTSPETQKGPKVFLYPKNGQNSDQQAHDRYDCYRFAVAQSGFDPMRGTGAAGEQQSDYERAQSACFEARGYANR